MNDYKICVIGLGNVGLDLAINFSKKFETIGFDINKKLIKNIKAQKKRYLKSVEAPENKLLVSHTHKLIVDCDIYIITVPTPVNKEKVPYLDSVIEATKLISKFLFKDNVVIYESTFYPGLTEKVCIPLLEKESKLKINKDFFVGYSPERINVGESKKMSNDIVKITSGSNQMASKIVDNIYRKVIKAGTYNVGSIKLAEAVKILENCQRDVNIAFMNEMSKFFNRINVDTKKVIKAASTKWNFSPFFPGLVGGDCIAVDPYYIIHLANEIKCDLPIINLARKTNEEMMGYVYNSIINKLSNQRKRILKLAFFGISYKENCNQTNNSMYLKIAKKLSKIYIVDIYDHLVENTDFQYELKNTKNFNHIKYDAIVIGSKHNEYKKITFKNYLNKSAIIVDIHGVSMYSENVIL